MTQMVANYVSAAVVIPITVNNILLSMEVPDVDSDIAAFPGSSFAPTKKGRGENLGMRLTLV